MGRPALEVADIFREHGPAWREAQRGHLSLAQLKVMSAITQCRTAALGGLFALLNFTVFVQARIGMLDGFMGAFVALAVAVLTSPKLTSRFEKLKRASLTIVGVNVRV